MWSLYEDEKELKPLVFSNGKTQEDIVKEVLEAINEGHKIIFIRGLCGTGKSAVALNLASNIGKTSIVVPIKSLQEQYTKDYTEKKYVLKNGKKLNIISVVGRQNFKCKFLEESEILNLRGPVKEKDAKLSDIFNSNQKKLITKEKNKTCDNPILPCKIEIKEKNIEIIKEYIKKNPSINISDFSSVNEVTRMSIAPICPYWSPILSEELIIKRFKEAKKIKYKGLNNKNFTIYQREIGCPYYEQYSAYDCADVIIFNSSKYIIENLMNRKPETELEIIDECDEFLDSFANQEQINISRLLYSLSTIYTENEHANKSLKKLIGIANDIKYDKKYSNDSEEIFPIIETSVLNLLEETIENPGLAEILDNEETSYLNHLESVARTFKDLFNETFFSIEKRENDLIIHLITTNLAEKFKELTEKNKIIVMMSGTIHSESVLKNIFGIKNFKIIEAETSHQGELIKCKNGFETDCSYSSFQNNRVTREYYLNSLSKCISLAKKPVLIHVNSFSDLPTEQEKTKFNLQNLPTQVELINEQKEDPFGKRITDFKNKKYEVLFTTKCNRGIDFPGDICNSIVVTRFPYPNISSIFWKILKKNKPTHFMNFYMDKAKRELLQKIYRGLRSKQDKVYLLSPDVRVLEFNI